MAFTDKRLRCVECGAPFLWTAGEQSFFAEKQLQHEPRRCRACKGRGTQRSAVSGSEARLAAQAVCCVCGRATTLPFKPVPGRPVFCRRCYQHRRGPAGSPA